MSDSQTATHLTAPFSLDFQPTNLQLQSPLFGILPGEIRNEIFAYVLANFEDEEETYAEDSFWYRPDFSAPHKADSTLLRTCKMAYVEGQKVFLAEAEWAFWFSKCPAGKSIGFALPPKSM